MISAEDRVNRHCPVGHGGLGVGHLAASEDDRLIGCSKSIFQDLIGDRVYVPYDEGARLEVVGPLGGSSRLRCLLPLTAR
jgi:hypothetical protein